MFLLHTIPLSYIWSEATPPHIHSLTFSFNLVPCFTTNYAAELVILVQFLSVSDQPFSPNHDKITFGD